MKTHSLKLCFVFASASLVACGGHKASSRSFSTSAPVQQGSSGSPLHPTEQNLSARDGWAFSSAGHDAAATDVAQWTDVRSHAQVVTWVDAGDDLYASFTSGDGAYTPAVAIQPRRYAGGQAPAVVGVLIFDTANHPDPLARTRDGDAILLFRAEDPGDMNHTSPQATTRLFSSYFDRSIAGLPTTVQTDATSGLTLEFQYGWQVKALPVDDDPDDRDAQGGRLDVSLAGWVSDASHRTHGGAALSTGDATSFVYAVWGQSRPAQGYETRLQHKAFDLTGEGFSFPSGQPVVSALQASAWIAHDGLLLTVDPDTADLTAVVFTASASPAVHTVEVDAPLPAVGHVYGPDEGLGHWLALYLDDDDARLATLTANGLANLQSLNPQGGNTTISQLDARMARDGAWIAASWIEDDDFLTCAIDAKRDQAQAADAVSNVVVQATLTAQFESTFQTELDYRRGVQSNHRRVNWLYQDEQALFVTGLEVTLSPTAAPTARQVGHHVVSHVPPLGPLAQRAVCYDRGDVDGNANVAFVAERDPQETGDQRLFHYSGTEVDVSQEAGQISAVAQQGQQQATGALTVCTTSVSPDVVRFPSYAGNHTAILFTEAREGTGEAALFHVAWDKTAQDLTPRALVSLDLPRAVEGFTCLRSINALDVYFGQAGHVMLNSWTPGQGWYQAGGLPAPLVVDDHHPEEVQQWVVLGDRDGVTNALEDGPSAGVFYDKQFGPSGDRRLLVRSRR